ncbi:MAG: CDP-alcohol phosphatidyltransferase family protein [Bacteroidetes bacterium]|nr:CDP-alcohol phosphatidyltransferase family protein [Bacteroidota bacterium]
MIPLNIPNVLSLYRLLCFPVVLYFALHGNAVVFTWLLCINLVTDILDGLIARKFNMMTEVGARLDSIADLGTYILAFVGVFCFKAADFKPYLFSFSIFIGLFIVCDLLALVKFRRLASLHLYSWKIGGYIQGLFFFTLFVFGFYTPFYYFAIIWGILSFIEHICVQLVLPELISNARGLYWVLRDRRRSDSFNETQH